ncbi:MAG: DUF86 domain-containing protein [Nitrospirae bacterium]|nr:DUF86 domain-containing protein [Nitrospirota bacterium]
MINKIFVQRKISLIQNELAHLMPFSKYSFNEIASDYIKQAAVERFLERVINRAIDINQHIIAELSTKDTEPPLDYVQTFLRLADFEIYPCEFAQEISVGTRNKLVHEYDKIDQEKIYSSISDCLKDYHKYCDYVFTFLEK